MKSPRVGVTGINDGLTWPFLTGLFGTQKTERVLECAWWWRHALLEGSLIDYLSGLHDRGRSVALAYESLARLKGEYPLGTPFNLLTGHAAENFSREYRVKPDPRHGLAVIRDSLHSEIARKRPSGHKLVDRSNRELLEWLSEAYSEPIVLRFNLHHPPGNAVKAVKDIVRDLQKERGKVITRKNRRSLSFTVFEAWDVRRWLEDDRGFVIKNESILGFPRSTRDVTRARNHAFHAADQFRQLGDKLKQYAEINGGRMPQQYLPLLLKNARKAS